MSGLLLPGAHRAAGLLDDTALVRAMLRTEVAWVRALSRQGAASPAHADAVAAAAEEPPDLDPRDVEDAGNPVLPLVRALRVRVPEAADVVHAGLTSQDVLDTALVLLARDGTGRVLSDLDRTARALAALADKHRGSVMAGRTLTRYAVPVTFGLKAAQWLAGVLDAASGLDGLRFPVQCGGAAGTLSRAGQVVSDPLAAASAFAEELDLQWPGLPWHTRRIPVTRVGDALALVHDALGVLAGDVLTLGRPEIGEVREGVVPGRGGSSTMPQKRNPVLAVLISSAAMQAPQLAAQLHVAAGRGVDERAPGAWHAEWSALRLLLELTVVAASQAADLAGSLEVDAALMVRRAHRVADELLTEAGGGADPGTYLGSADAFVDAALERWKGHRHDA